MEKDASESEEYWWSWLTMPITAFIGASAVTAVFYFSYSYLMKYISNFIFGSVADIGVAALFGSGFFGYTYTRIVLRMSPHNKKQMAIAMSSALVSIMAAVYITVYFAFYSRTAASITFSLSLLVLIISTSAAIPGNHKK